MNVANCFFKLNTIGDAMNTPLMCQGLPGIFVVAKNNDHSWYVPQQELAERDNNRHWVTVIKRDGLQGGNY